MNNLIDKVIEQIEVDLSWGDKSAIAELLSFIPEDYLLGFLGERFLDKQSKATNITP